LEKDLASIQEKCADLKKKKACAKNTVDDA
jgi:hypothetical protein